MADHRSREAATELIAYWSSGGPADQRARERLRQLARIMSFEVPAERFRTFRQAPMRHKRQIEEALASFIDDNPAADRLVVKILDQEPLVASSLRYGDFSIRFERPDGDSLPVHITSPAGDGRGRLCLPFDLGEVDRWLDTFAANVRASNAGRIRDLRSEGEAENKKPAAEEPGGQLFRALFDEQVYGLFSESLGMIRREEDRGLRLKLCFDAGQAVPARLAALPWEFLYRRDRRSFLGLERKTPIVRYLDVPQAAHLLPLELPLRVLLVMSRPSEEMPLDLKKEREDIERAMATRREVKVTVLIGATPNALRGELLRQRYDVLHFMGHGGFDQVTGQGSLIFEDRQGQGRPLSGALFAAGLRDFGHLRLVVLNACGTGQTAYRDGENPFAGVANALVLAALPAVVAMQFPISDRAALRFSAALYRRLAAGDPIDAATVEGRLAVRLEDEDSWEWGTPVLYMRVPDGRLFRQADDLPPKG